MSAVSTRILRKGGYPVITYRYFGPSDLSTQRSTSDIETFIPVAHGPSAKALSSTKLSSPKVERAEYWINRRVAIRSPPPRTQLVAVPLEPDDSSITAPRSGSRPP